MLVLGDPTKLTPCNRKPGGAYETPWDTCCDMSDVVAQSIATIQIIDEDGRPLKTGLKGLHGIKEHRMVMVTTMEVDEIIAELELVRGKYQGVEAL